MSYSFKLTLRGNFWDIYIYMEYLYLVTYDNELLICNWKKLKELNISEISENDLEKYSISRYSLQMQDLNSDICIANKKIYLSNNYGLFLKQIDSIEDGNFEKILDYQSFSLTTNGLGYVTMSCGNEGLFELGPNIFDSKGKWIKDVDKKIFKISSNHSTMCNYYGDKLYNFSYTDDAEFYYFDQINTFKKNNPQKFSEKEIFNQNQIRDIYDTNLKEKKISWFHDNKIYRIINNRQIEVVKLKKEENFIIFEPSYIMNFQSWKGKILTGISSKFGVIVECENALVVSFEENNFLNIAGEITKYRTYPNSKAYQNHLHVVLDDRIEIYQFYNNTSRI